MTDLPSDRNFENFKIDELSHAAHRLTIFMELNIINDKKITPNVLLEREKLFRDRMLRKVI
jgi:hypothetical protein